ncbi:MAG: glycoside hydrolase family 2 TIM barrel-domain containing protein [Ignavibacteriaceae bacterium]|nr:glycoside hydrolase family 2 TIM barrel-domain containing protein [Ignavibacteriaceae bacterium]
MNKIFKLNDNWEFSLNKKTSSNIDKIKSGAWFKAVVPGTVHTDLLNNKLIPDPFYSDNELGLQWIGNMDWDYRTEFDLPKSFNNSKPVFIKFDGVDTISDIFLNDIKIGSTQNMFCSYEFDITSLLKRKRNELLVRFASPYTYSLALENKYGKLPVSLNSQRVYIRKAQYSFGWDWGPSLATSGLWKDVSLCQKEDALISHFTFNTISVSDKKGSVELKADIENPLNKNLKLVIILSHDKYKYERVIELNNNEILYNFDVPDPSLWWPNGYGNPSLYDLNLQLYENKYLFDEKIAKVGIRTIELQLNDNDKNTFRLIVNRRKIFARGVNWIPADLFLPRVTEDKYRRLLGYAKNGNMNIVRVWGGGFYENNIFYELCDELGLLVWNDFMFACAAYPEYPEFIDNVSEEFRQNIRRLQNHPSLAVWCGNNENEWNWAREQGSSYKVMPGYKIYHQILPDILSSIDPQRPYWPSSPFGFDDYPNSEISGNRHQWELWSMWKDYNRAPEDNSLFITEFGFQAPANQPTLEEAIPEKDRNVQSRIFEFHNKQVEGNERLFRYLSAHLPVLTQWKDFIYLTQLNQGLALKTCLQHWRANYPVTNGTIIWQLNDCWPVTSWAVVDSNLIPKQSFYHVKNIFSRQIIYFNKKGESIEIILLNNSLEVFRGRVKIQIVNLKKTKPEFNEQKKIKLKENSRIIVSSVADFNTIVDGSSVIIVSVYDSENNMVHRNYYAEKEWKHMHLSKAEITLKKHGRESFAVETNMPAFFITLDYDGIVFSNNSFILLPGEKEIVNIDYLKDVKLKLKNINVNSLNNYLS